MNLTRVERAINKAKSRIAKEKLLKMGVATFIDANGKRAAVYHVFCKKGEDKNPETEKRIEEIGRVCDVCGIALTVMYFIDDLGDETE